MRQVLSLSFPQQAIKKIKIRTKQRGFPSVSSYLRYLIDLDDNLISDEELLNDVKRADKDYKNDKCIKANSVSEALKIYDSK
jgi:hypothetical protein